MIDYLSRVEKALTARKFRYKRTGNRLVLNCVSHEDKHPSMYIFDDGTIYCFGCGYRSKVSTLLGLSEFDFETVGNGEIGKDYFPSVNTIIPRLPEYPKLDEPLITKERFGLSLDVLRRVDAREDETGIIFPIYYRSKLIGWHKRLNTPTADCKYVSSPRVSGEHFTSYFYPMDLLNGTRTIIIVEGILDALAFMQHGLPAVANFGLRFSENKHRILREKMFRKILVGFDNDSSGIKAEIDLFLKLKDEFNVGVLPVCDKKNPRENLDNISYIEQIKERINYE